MFKLLKRNKQTRHVSGGSGWADAIYSMNATTGEYILYKCSKLQRDLALENIVVETKLLPFKRFCVSVNGIVAFKGNFDFVEHCREASPTAFIETMRKHVRVAP